MNNKLGLPAFDAKKPVEDTGRFHLRRRSLRALGQPLGAMLRGAGRQLGHWAEAEESKTQVGEKEKNTNQKFQKGAVWRFFST